MCLPNEVQFTFMHKIDAKMKDEHFELFAYSRFFPAAGVLKEFGNRNSAIIICETLCCSSFFYPTLKASTHG